MLELIWKMRNLTLMSIMLTFGFHTYADDKISHGKGLIHHDKDTWHKLEKKTPKVIGVRPNKIGASRIHEHLKKNNHPPRHIPIASFNEDEFITSLHLNPEDLKNAKSAVGTPLPSSVDNSKLACFPRIGDQQSLGSCVAWATTYYGATHEIGLANGYNNKNYAEHVLSPKWTYNMSNWGEDDGTYIEMGYNLLAQNGAITYPEFPYDSNYREWDTDQQHWINALSYRMQPLQMIPGLANPQDLSVIKGLLNNGHILSIGTYIDSWVYTKIKPDPENPNSPYVGQLACTYMNGQDGGHNISIVGYDDKIWIDVNGNGVVDPGERGAFLLCNSWGTDWGNYGFVWVSYDAFLPTSAVTNGPTSGRVGLCEDMGNVAFSQVAKSPNYKPSLIGTFTLTQTQRDQIEIQGGIGSADAEYPENYFKSSALFDSGGPYAFDGTTATTPLSGSFALDFTDLLPNPTGTLDPKRYMIQLVDIAAGNPTQLSNFTLIDNIHNVTVPTTGTFTVDNNKVYPFILYDFYNQNVPDNTNPTVTITSPINNSTVQGTIQITANATDNVGINRVEFYLDNQLGFTDDTTPYIYTLDTTQLADGNHTITAMAFDASNNSASSTININVHNVSLPTSYYINAGGPDVIFNGITWKNDAPYINGGDVYSIDTIFNKNPIYKSIRFAKKLIYNFPIENGSYSIYLKFAEIYWNEKGKRLLNVRINGMPRVNNFDIFAFVGFGYLFDLHFLADEKNNSLNIEIEGALDNAMLSGIQITKR